MKAVASGTRNGSEKLVMMWGGSPASEPLPFGVNKKTLAEEQEEALLPLTMKVLTKLKMGRRLTVIEQKKAITETSQYQQNPFSRGLKLQTMYQS